MRLTSAIYALGLFISLSLSLNAQPTAGSPSPASTLAAPSSETFLLELPALRKEIDRPNELLEKLRSWEPQINTWTDKKAKAEFFRLAARCCQMVPAPLEQQIGYWRSCLEQNALDAVTQEDVALALAYAISVSQTSSVEETRQALNSVLRNLSAAPNSIILRQLLHVQANLAEKRGEPTAQITQFLVNESLARPKNFRECCQLARWFKKQGRSDGQTYWWSQARQSFSDWPDQIRSQDAIPSLWELAPSEHKAECQGLVRELLGQLSPIQQAECLLQLLSAFEQGSGDPPPSWIVEPLTDNVANDELAWPPFLREKCLAALARHYRRQDPALTLQLREQLQAILAKQPMSPPTAQMRSFNLFSIATDAEDLWPSARVWTAYLDGISFAELHYPQDLGRFYFRALIFAKRQHLTEALERLRERALGKMAHFPSRGKGMVLEAILSSYEGPEVNQRLNILTQLQQHYRGELESARKRQQWEEFAQASRGLAGALRSAGDQQGQLAILRQALQAPIPSQMHQILLLELLSACQDPDEAQALYASAVGDTWSASDKQRAIDIYLGLLARTGRHYEVLQLTNNSQGSWVRYRSLVALRMWSAAMLELEKLEKHPTEQYDQSHCLSQRIRLHSWQSQWTQGDACWEQLRHRLIPRAERGVAWDWVSYGLARSKNLQPTLDKILAQFSTADRTWILTRSALYCRLINEPEQALKYAQQVDLKMLDISERPQLESILGVTSKAKAQEALPLGAVLDQLRLARPELENLVCVHSTNIRPLQQNLKPGQLLLCYLPTGIDILVIRLSPTRADYQRLPLDVGLQEEQIRSAHKQLAIGRCPDLTQLSNLLVAPVFDKVSTQEAQEILIVPYGEFWKLPFAALKTPTGHLLGEKPISLLTSSDLARLLQGRWTRFRSGPTLAIGAPPAADLPGAAKELESVKAIWPETRLLTGEQATAASLLQNPRKLRILHVATHSQFRPDDPLHSSVMLHQSQLSLADLHRLPLDERALVVLSSCQGALGSAKTGSEPVSLATAVAAAGAQSVIASLWDADDEAAQLFFGKFYTLLKQGQSVGKSFAGAQQACRAKHPDPSVWANFVLIGNPR